MRSREGRPSPLPTLAVQYEDYAWWQHHNATEIFDQQLGYWREQLAAPMPRFEIPPDYTRPARHSAAGGRVTVRLPPISVDS